ncbi:MAG TPA: PIN domain-containing protein [Terriglobales bacterium]|nr:PIN domain-containing protein [Terriglobales bacterium]
MIAYVDSSVILRLVLGQANALAEWRHINRGISTALTRVEVLRTLDRLRLRAALSDAEMSLRRSAVLQGLDLLELVEADAVVLERAAQPMPTELRTLDAIHLATALLWRERSSAELVMATHDRRMGVAAQAHGFKVVGT